MATLRSLKAAAKKLGAIVLCESSGYYCVYQVESPNGMVWSNGCHALRVEWRKCDNCYRKESIADALDRMAQGLATCDDADCDICKPAAAGRRG